MGKDEFATEAQRAQGFGKQDERKRKKEWRTSPMREFGAWGTL